jgi:hypothetical protein
MKLTTLADVWKLIDHLPAAARQKNTWKYVAARLHEAAQGGDPRDVAVPLMIVLSLESVEFQYRSALRPT